MGRHAVEDPSPSAVPTGMKTRPTTPWPSVKRSRRARLVLS